MKQRTVCRHPALVTPGAILARSISRAGGGVLLAAGAELDAEKLAHLHQRGVDLVFIAEDDPRQPAAIASEIAAAEAHVAQIFAGESSDSRDELGRAILSYRRTQAA